MTAKAQMTRPTPAICKNVIPSQPKHGFHSVEQDLDLLHEHEQHYDHPGKGGQHGLVLPAGTHQYLV